MLEKWLSTAELKIFVKGQAIVLLLVITLLSFRLLNTVTLYTLNTAIFVFYLLLVIAAFILHLRKCGAERNDWVRQSIIYLLLSLFLVLIIVFN